ncbi:hypothetical protein [Saccharothrix sp. ST-888]|uniref:hypothetical protein n=1 Tax=Saccharothrix sp. ST-888 TaxID=1427391 RepID=UPI0012E069A3|nr:hypothetical protein [Saccharothrix sp. ST-888]
MDAEFPSAAYAMAFRGMLRDVVACHEFATVCQHLDIVPPSEDVDAYEHWDSHARVDAVRPVLSEIMATSDLAADVVHAISTGSRTDEGQLPDITALARACVTGTIIRLVAQGTLQVTP